MNEATLQYMRQHADDDVRQLALRGKAPDVDLRAAIEQIAGRQAARQKLPSWAATEGVLYPPHLSMEQCSGEPAARYKAELASLLTSGASHRFVDLTGGFGIDFSFISQHFAEAVYVECQEHLCQLARHNFPLMGIRGEVVCADATAYLQQMQHASLVFIDPARRDSHGGRTYGIADCTPDVLQLRDMLLQKADCILLKLSPMLDWRKAVSDLGQQYVSEVHIVSVQNECKELLIVLKESEGDLDLHCVNLLNDGISQESFVCKPSSFVPHPSSLTPRPSSFLYEPNASIMKAGCFDAVASAWGVSQIAPNSHLFVSDQLLTDFPGRSFQIVSVCSMNKKELKTALRDITQANITVRNFPLSVAELRKRLKTGEGGSNYIFATTLAKGSHVLLICRK